jgi:catechol 2,3-dioxygenase-like lactoylglutathione lyase family enzyme
MMRATALNHVSIPAVDLEASAAFYRDVLDLEEIPAPNFGMGVRWFRLGSQQLHLFQVGEQGERTYQHLAIEVDDVEQAFTRLRDLGMFEEGRFGKVYLLPGGAVQMYFRDPADNLIEIDWPDVSTIDTSVFGDRLKRLDEVFPQTPKNLEGRLFFQAAGSTA